MSMAFSAPTDFKAAYRDSSGNLLVTYPKKSGDTVNGELGVMYCKPTGCADLVSEWSFNLLGDTFLEFKYNQEKGEARLKMNPARGLIELSCSASGSAITLKPVSGKDLNSLAAGIKTGKIPIVSAPTVRKTSFLSKVSPTGELIYMDSGSDNSERFFIGKPGAMRPMSVKPYPDSECGFSGCAGLYIVGSILGFGGTDLDTRGQGTWGDKSLEKIEPSSFDLGSLKIPGVPTAKDYNAMNPCTPEGSPKQAPPGPNSVTPPTTGR
jgi:hypothetical protein